MKSGITIKYLKESFPNLKVYWSEPVPANLVSKTELKRRKLFTNTLEPCAVKGNTQVGEGYYFLYDINKTP